MPTEMELTLEQTQQGVSYEVSNIRVILSTMKMEILLEPTSNKLMVDPHGFEGYVKMVVKVFKDHIQDKLRNKLKDLKSMITTSNHKLMIEVNDCKLKTKVKA
ncbi:hypothetical protein Tco_1174908 [Tanacetum coccineum]